MKLQFPSLGPLAAVNPANRRNLIRIGICFLVVVAGYSTILTRLFYEQVVKAGGYQEDVERQTLRRVRIPAARGRILASNGTLLANTVPSYGVELHLTSLLKRQRSKTIEAVQRCAERIALRLGRTNTLTNEDIIRHMNHRPGLALALFRDLNENDMAALLEMPDLPDGIEISAEPAREYPLKTTAAHLLGWVGKDDPMRADDRKQFTYYTPDLIGRNGLEKAYDLPFDVNGRMVEGLRGESGERLLLVNNRGYAVRELSRTDSFCNGNDIRLTIDIHAQTLAEQLMHLYRGAFVLMDVSNGNVVASVSTPGYDLSKTLPYLSARVYRDWNVDSDKPLLDRVAASMNMPGSTIKPIVALGIMKKFSSASTVTCTGSTSIAGRPIGCTGVHGEIDLRNAIKYSCNCYFVERGVSTGLPTLQRVFKSAGIGTAPPGYPLRAAAGHLPSPELKLKSDGLPWSAHSTGLVSIGQGMIDVSPLQIAMYMAAIANGGSAFAPNLLDAVLSPDGHSVVARPLPKPAITLDATAFEIDEVQQGMYMVVNEARGTGRLSKNKNSIVFGKSGTAEVGSVLYGNNRKNTWFAGYAKHVNGKTYAFCTFVESGQSGGGTNAPIVAEFFNNWEPGAPPVPPRSNQPISL